MIKKSLKYLIVIFANAIALIILLALWTDRLELTFNDWVRGKELLKIIGFSIVSLLSMRFLVSYFRHKNITTVASKIKISAFLTFLISSYLYIDYSTKVINNIILNGQIRNRIAYKIKPSNVLANGTKAEGLTNEEYQQITNFFWFPKLPGEASNINYSYGYDGFLPDYLFTLTYDLPAEIKIDIINSNKGHFSKYQSFVIVDNIKRVTYSESED